ncbi:DTW domain-containing protein [Reinekea forsetii]|nr:DTW domain-containing protein [Reinekea forsetii]
MKKHAVHLLYDQRISRSTRPFKARGAGVRRCLFCRIDEQFCICALKPKVPANAGFLLLYYDDEVLKPSNTGRLIADIVSDTFAFIWQRTQVEEGLLAVLNEPQWQPLVVFPSEYAQEGRAIVESALQLDPSKRPLFILLDGSWREAKKMFRNSPYLQNFPVLSFNSDQRSRYLVRKAIHEHHLATAEVAAMALNWVGEHRCSHVLDAWFDVFSFQYQKGVKNTNLGDETSLARLAALVDAGGQVP